MKKRSELLSLVSLLLFESKLLIIIAFFLVFVGCSDKDDDRDIIPATYLNVSNHLFEFPNNGGVCEVEVTSDGSWMVISKEDWLTTQIRGVGNKTISIVAKPNTLGGRREATMKVVATNPSDNTIEELKVELKVVQADRVPMFVIVILKE